MKPSALPLLRFVSAFLWADLELKTTEISFFTKLAQTLGVKDAGAILAMPPLPEEIDPTRVSFADAMEIREACLRAIASDGVVEEREMELFELLDELLPLGPAHQPS